MPEDCLQAKNGNGLRPAWHEATFAARITRLPRRSRKPLACIIHGDLAFRGNLAKQVGLSFEKRGPPRAKVDGPRWMGRRR